MIDAANLMRAFRSAIRKSGIPHLRWHDLRHTFATRLAQCGMDLYKTQKLGRWKEMKMVQRYAHHYPESLRKGVEILDKIRHESVTNQSQFQKEGVSPNG